jgi:Entner-Doudoroff aldolase
MRPVEFVERFRSERASAILRTRIEDAAGPAMDAAIRGGFSIVEFTLNTPGALARIEEFSRRDELVVGAGTVLDVEQARDAVRAGARFLVSPVVDEAMIDEARRLGVAAMPGAHSPTELLRAQRAGAPLQKLFPAPHDGPAFVRACLGPLPTLKIVPTSGVDASNAARFLEAGAWAVGFVGPLFVAEDLEHGRFDRIERRARELLAATRSS